MNWLKNTVRAAIRGVCDFEYRLNAGIAMWALRKRWHIFKMHWPVYQELHKWQKAYWEMYDQWAALDLDHRMLYIKHQDLLDEVRYWETRHAKVLNYIEKQMEMTEGDFTK
jgi:hypothetical protein